MTRYCAPVHARPAATRHRLWKMADVAAVRDQRATDWHAAAAGTSESSRPTGASRLLCVGVLAACRADVRLRKHREESTVSDEQVAPETKGVTTELLTTVDLGPEIQGMAGRRLRMRLVTIEPGGVFGPVHDHKGRPGAVYVLQGTITDHRDRVSTDYGPGVGWPEDRNTTHWLENRGTIPASRSRSTSSGNGELRPPRPPRSGLDPSVKRAACPDGAARVPSPAPGRRSALRRRFRPYPRRASP